MKPKAQKLPKSKSIEVVLQPWAAWGYAQTIAAALSFVFLQSMVQICYQNACFYE
jgi:hypothetical protein